MSGDTLIILSFLFIGLLFFYFLIKSQIDKPKTDPTLSAWLKSLQTSFDSTNRNTSAVMQKNYQDLFLRLDQATSVIGDLKREAGAFSEVSRSMKDLHDYLKSPKLRGNIGEQVLADLIHQIFPKEAFYLQHHFKSGQIVDVAVKTQGGLLPIDSKFPMENFQRIYQSNSQNERDSSRQNFVKDVRKHVKDISSKYILPGEGTLDFALMYIPSESVYYEIVVESGLMEYARDARVYPVSPTTLYANLQMILMSLEGQKIAGKTAEVFRSLRVILKDYEKLGDNYSLLSKHLTNAYNSLNSSNQSLNQLGNSLLAIKNLKQIGDGKEDLEV